MRTRPTAMMSRTLSVVPVASKAYYERNEVAYDANYCRGCDTIEPQTRNGCTMPRPDEIVRGNGRTVAEISFFKIFYRRSHI